jgi:hypothetical protein
MVACDAGGWRFCLQANGKPVGAFSGQQTQQPGREIKEEDHCEQICR